MLFRSIELEKIFDDIEKVIDRNGNLEYSTGQKIEDMKIEYRRFLEKRIEKHNLFNILIKSENKLQDIIKGIIRYYIIHRRDDDIRKLCNEFLSNSVVEEIRDGLVIVKGNQGRFEVRIDEKNIKTSSTSSPARTRTGQTTRSDSSGRTGRKTSTRPNTTKTSGASTNAQKDQKYQDLVNKLKQIGYPDSSDKTLSKEERAQKNETIQKLIADFMSKNISIGEEDAQELGELGEMLKRMK